MRLQRQQLVEEARRTAVRDIQTRLDNLFASLAKLREASSWGDVQTVSSSDERLLGVARTGGAAAGAFSLLVDRLATADQVGQRTGFAAAAAADRLTISVGGQTVTVDVAAGDDAAAIAARVNGASGSPVLRASWTASSCSPGRRPAPPRP